MPVVPLLLLAVLAAASGRSVLVSIAADWVREPVVEAAEYLAEQSQTLFLEFQYRLCQYSGAVNASIAVDVAAALLPASQEQLMRTAVGIGYYLPKVQFQHSISAKYAYPCDGDAFFVLHPGDITFCTWSALAEKLKAVSSLESHTSLTEEVLLKSDHIISVKSLSESRHHAVLYGVYGSSSYCRLYEEMRGSSEDVVVSTRYHHGLASTNASFTYLQGYGVFLDIKNMEYKTLDDRAEAPASETEVEESDEDKVEADESEGSSEEKTMEVQKVRDLGLQVVSSVLKEQDRLAALEAILYNFPMRASRLSKRRVSRSLRRSVADWYQRRLIMTLPHDTVYINGLKVDLGGASFNIYDVFSKLTKEMRLLRSFSDLPLSESLRSQVLSIAKTMSTSSKSNMQDFPRVDVSLGSKGVVTFMNNLEKDSMYKRWPQTVQQLLMPSWSLHAIAKNLYTVVIVLDPLSERGVQLALTAKALWQQQYPIRFGFVLYPGGEAEKEKTISVDETSRATRAHICDLFSFAKEYQSITIALSFLLNLFDETDFENPHLFTINDLIQAYTKVFTL